MYRLFKIEDEQGKKLIFQVHPDQSDLLIYSENTLDITLETIATLHLMITNVQKFMGGNTINKIEIEEII